MSEPNPDAGLDEAVTERGGAVVIRVRAQPGARRNAVIGLREAEVCFSVTAAPEKGQANDAIARLLAKTLGVARGRVELIAGPTNRHKRFAVTGADLGEVRQTFRRLLAPNP